MTDLNRITAIVCAENMAMEAGRNSRIILERLDMIEKKLDRICQLLAKEVEQK